jgi:tRNA(fMet)-specific endonuclease VapC
MYLLDTNHCTFLIEGEPKVVNHFRELGKVEIATSAIVAGELRFMAQNSQQRTANLIKIRAFLKRIDIYPIDDETAEIYGDFKSEIIKSVISYQLPVIRRMVGDLDPPPTHSTWRWGT